MHTKFCDSCVEVVKGRQFLMLDNVCVASVCGYKILHFWANPQKYQTLLSAKNSHLKVYRILVAYALCIKQ